MKHGDRVKLISAEHGEDSWNPVWGGRQGKIVGTSFDYDGANNGGDASYVFSVDWDNGHSNNYRRCDLEVWIQPVKLPEELFEL